MRIHLKKKPSQPPNVFAPCNVRKYSLSSKLILLTVVSLASVGICTAVYYATRRAQQEVLDYGDIVDYDFGREGGHLVPNLNATMQGGGNVGERVRIITNSKGFRNRKEFRYKVPRGTYRVLLIGDSYIDGMRTDQKRTIGYLLGQHLNAECKQAGFRRCEVMISGQSSPTEGWYGFQEHGSRYQPHLVVQCVTLGNDLTWYSYKASLNPIVVSENHVELEWNKGQADRIGRSRPDLMLPSDAYCSDSVLRSRKDASRGKPWSGDLHLPAFAPVTASRRKVPAAGFFVSLGIFYQPTMPEIETMYEDLQEVLVHYYQCTQRHKSQFLVVLFPSRIQVYDSEWYFLTQRYALDEESFNMTYPNDRLRDTCKSHQIDVLDLLPALRADVMRAAATNVPHPLFRLRGDMHLNERGQEVSARAIAEVVAKKMSQSD